MSPAEPWEARACCESGRVPPCGLPAGWTMATSGMGWAHESGAVVTRCPGGWRLSWEEGGRVVSIGGPWAWDLMESHSGEEER